MLKYQSILNDVNRVIGFSQNMPANSENLLISWAENKEELVNKFLDGNLIKSFGQVEMKLSTESRNKEFEKFIEDFKYSSIYGDFYKFLKLNQDGFFDNVVNYTYTTENNEVITNGMRLLKAFKFFIKDKELLDKYQTAASRLIQNNVLKGELCVSVHPLDFLSSSENVYNWRSCHALDGEYRSGNLSYMVDKSTMICYIKGDTDTKLPNFPEDILWNSKKWRMLLFTSENYEVMFAGRQYPFSLGTSILDTILEDIIPGSTKITNRKEFGLWYDEPRSWSHWHKDQITSVDYEEFKEDNNYLSHTYVPIHNNIYNITDIIKDNPGGQHFNDLLHSSYYKPYYAWSHRTRHKPIIAIGGKIPCPCCGDPDRYVDNSNSMCCYSCYDKYAEEDDEHCRCGVCGSLQHVDDMYWVDCEGHYVCGECYDSDYFTCECCGEIYPFNEVVKTDEGEYLCEACAGDN